jgi:hypothetical protein
MEEVVVEQQNQGMEEVVAVADQRKVEMKTTMMDVM